MLLSFAVELRRQVGMSFRAVVLCPIILNWKEDCNSSDNQQIHFLMSPYVLRGGSERAPVLVWANTSKSSWVGGGLQLGRELKVLLTLSAPMSGGQKKQQKNTAMSNNPTASNRLPLCEQQRSWNRIYFSHVFYRAFAIMSKKSNHCWS